ncbi:hypothetical protein HCN44_004082 [Aphidius gifuensis]|uniref:Connector enhancer of kinase suppressor of ras n=1 Tax=Aphidius gifuensis TaxID=684658 RepID=A0A835CVP8_APHGI|nr:hypothetical protein HCN44_004082 [Aphidius gifuensis]
MAYVNVAEWKTEQICEWLKGLDNSVLPYVHSFTNNKVNGQQLLSLRPEDLEQLGVIKFGHQEILLEAVEYLRNFHYELDRENLQLLALRLSCQSHSLYNELSKQNDSKPVTTQTLSDVVGVVNAVKPLVRWLDRPPFSGQLEYNDKKTQLLKLSIEMSMCAQRDRFADKPIEEIRTTCEELGNLADYIIQDIADPMILQPSSLDLATLKKRPGDDLGFYILPSFHGTHQIAEIKFGSVAHQCGKMEEGDEIVQVNYQTVVGWERKNVLELFNESPAEVLLTLKRRPRHTKVYGQIYIKPYRLPSNKKTPYATRWQHNLPSPRPEFLTIPDFTMPLPSSDSDSEVEQPLSIRLYASKPRSLVQRRATITGASPITKSSIDIEEFWRELKQEHNTTFHLRDKAASCAHGLDNVQSSNIRPQTCLGIEQTKRNNNINNNNNNKYEGDKKVVKFNDKITEVNNNNNMVNINDKNNNDKSCDNSTVPLNKSNDSNVDDIDNNNLNNEINNSLRCRKERGKLDKSHSTPAYDLTDTIPVEIIDISQNIIKVNNNNNNNINYNCSSSINKIVKTDIINIKNNDNILLNDDKKNENGNVAQKINNIEDKYLNEINEINDIDIHKDHCNDDSSFIDTNSSTKDDDLSISNENYEMDKLSDICGLSRESSEEKSESTSSYMEGIYSSSSETDAPLVKFKNVNSISLTENNNTSSNNTTVDIKNNSSNELNLNNDEILKINSPSTSISSVSSSLLQLNKKTLLDKESSDSSDTKITICLPIEEKNEPKKLDIIKLRSTPPEPPPRKYFNKPSPLNLNINIPPEPPERPKIPDRNEIKKDVRKIQNDNNNYTVTINNNRDCFDGYRDFVEKSLDFIDEPGTPINDKKTSSSSTTTIDNFGYAEINENNLKEDNKIDNKYDRFGTGNYIQNQTEMSNHRTIDLTDGAGCSRQIQNEKSRTLEKDKHNDKGVVNRAMMVARSIGLHTSSKISTSSSSSASPRSSRKRNIILAKRRNVSVKDIGQGDLEGWLTYRSRGAGGAWARSWFILKGSLLYRFKNHDSIKSDCLIALPGFTASQADEVKSRKYSFKVYHTGTVFYFAADTDDSLILWLDFINKATLGADSNNRTSGLFSETDESDSESTTKSTIKTTSEKAFGSLKKLGRKDSGINKEHDIGGASLDRKYLRFLGAKTQNVPVPTAQFRSYRRVLPSSSSSSSSTPNRKPDNSTNSPDLRVTVAGSTFYGLTSSHSATDVPTTSQDMGDYRQTTDRSQSSRSRRPDDLRGFVTLEEFMLSHQSEDRQAALNNAASSSPRQQHQQQQQRNTSLNNDHINMNYRQLDVDNNNGVVYGHSRGFSNDFSNNGMIYGHPRNGEETLPTNNRQQLNLSSSLSSSSGYGFPRTPDDRTTQDHRFVESIYGNRSDSDTNSLTRNDNHSNSNNTNDNKYDRSIPSPRKPWESTTTYTRRIQEGAVYYPPKQNDTSSSSSSTTTYGKQEARSRLAELSQSRDPHGLAAKIYSRVDNKNDNNSNNNNPQSLTRRFIRDNGYSGSSGDLTCCSKSDTLQRARNEATVCRKGSFNLNDRKNDYNNSPKKTIIDKQTNWIDSLRRNNNNDKKTITSLQKSRLKTVAQYQPPPIPLSPFEQDGMRAAFEMHLDNNKNDNNVPHKTSRLKSLFSSNKSPQKLNNFDYPKDTQKTLLGSPRLHRALFRDKNNTSTKQQQQQQQYQQSIIGRSGSQSPGDSGISQSISSYSGISQSHTLSHSFSSVSSVSDWSPDGISMNSGKYTMAHQVCQKRPSNASVRSLMNPPTLPYIPPPTSPPPPDDYPGLEYPPIFEPGTYSLSDTSLLRKKEQKNIDDNDDDDGGHNNHEE